MHRACQLVAQSKSVEECGVFPLENSCFRMSDRAHALRQMLVHSGHRNGPPSSSTSCSCEWDRSWSVLTCGLKWITLLHRPVPQPTNRPTHAAYQHGVGPRRANRTHTARRARALTLDISPVEDDHLVRRIERNSAPACQFGPLATLARPTLPRRLPKHASPSPLSPRQRAAAPGSRSTDNRLEATPQHHAQTTPSQKRSPPSSLSGLGGAGFAWAMPLVHSPSIIPPRPARSAASATALPSRA